MNFSGKWTGLEYHPELGNLVPKGHVWYVLTDRWILAIKYRIPMLHSTEPKKQNKKEGPSVDA
jgi:hypothetical protein